MIFFPPYNLIIANLWSFSMLIFFKKTLSNNLILNTRFNNDNKNVDYVYFSNTESFHKVQNFNSSSPK